MPQIEPEKYYLHNNKLVKCLNRWAQGKFFTYHFSDGFSFNGDPEPYFKSGELSEYKPIKVDDLPKITGKKNVRVENEY